MSGISIRDKNILDEGVKHLERVRVNDLSGVITGVDFRNQTVRLEVTVPAHMVSREATALTKAENTNCDTKKAESWS